MNHPKSTVSPSSIPEYIQNQSPEIQPLLWTLTETIRQSAPEAEEKISWGMATFTLHGNLLHFSAAKHHIGFHPAPSAITAFLEELKDYTISKGTIRLPYNQALPLSLIERIVRFRVQEQKEGFNQKKLKKTGAVHQNILTPSTEFLHHLKECGLLTAFFDRPVYQQNTYSRWIADAKKVDTKHRRLEQICADLLGGCYMGNPTHKKTK